MMFLKALSYSLNNPCKEMLYNPTSTDVKFKAKSWIDIFGQRGTYCVGCSAVYVGGGSVRVRASHPMISISRIDPLPHTTPCHMPVYA